MFRTSESGDKGQLLDGSPSYVTNDAALVENLGLDYKVVQGGSETALISSLRQAEQQEDPLLAYFYSPQWLLSEVPLVKIDLPKYTPGCDADPAKIACDYPDYDLDKIVSTKFAESGSPAYTLVKNFQWTDDDQNSVARSIALDGLTDDEAAKKFVDANPALVAKWLRAPAPRSSRRRPPGSGGLTRGGDLRHAVAHNALCFAIPTQIASWKVPGHARNLPARGPAPRGGATRRHGWLGEDLEHAHSAVDRLLMTHLYEPEHLSHIEKRDAHCAVIALTQEDSR